MSAPSATGSNPATLPVGGVFQGRYEVVRCIKAGGMGAVYEVIHLETKRRRALKVMLPSMVSDPELRARFKLEAQVAAEIESDHIVETFDAGVDPETGAPFLVMELLRGRDLAGELEARGTLPAAEVIALGSQAALALDKTHAAGIVHRDLKPENLFLTKRDDGTPRLKVLDFGIAKVVAQSTTAKQTRSIGTPVYMSPEQIHGDGKIDARADLYALAHIVYALLVGEPFWEEEASNGDSVYPLLVKVMQGASESATSRALRRRQVTLPPAFDAWFARGTNIDPKARFGSASELVIALGAATGVAVDVVDARARVSALPQLAQDQAEANAIALGQTHISTSNAASSDATLHAPAATPSTASTPNTAAASGRTTSPIASDKVPVAVVPKNSTRVSRGLLVGGAMVILGMGSLARAFLTGANSAAAPAGTSLASAAPSSVVAPASSAAAMPTVTPAATAIQPRGTETEPVVTVATAAAPSSTAAPVAEKKTSAPSKPLPAAKPKPNCDPPVTIDAAGREHPKPECM